MKCYKDCETDELFECRFCHQKFCYDCMFEPDTCQGCASALEPIERISMEAMETRKHRPLTTKENVDLIIDGAFRKPINNPIRTIDPSNRDYKAFQQAKRVPVKETEDDKDNT